MNLLWGSDLGLSERLGVQMELQVDGGGDTNLHQARCWLCWDRSAWLGVSAGFTIGGPATSSSTEERALSRVMSGGHAGMSDPPPS